LCTFCSFLLRLNERVAPLGVGIDWRRFRIGPGHTPKRSFFNCQFPPQSSPSLLYQVALGLSFCFSPFFPGWRRSISLGYRKFGFFEEYHLDGSSIVPSVGNCPINMEAVSVHLFFAQATPTAPPPPPQRNAIFSSHVPPFTSFSLRLLFHRTSASMPTTLPPPSQACEQGPGSLAVPLDTTSAPPVLPLPGTVSRDRNTRSLIISGDAEPAGPDISWGDSRPFKARVIYQCSSRGDKSTQSFPRCLADPRMYLDPREPASSTHKPSEGNGNELPPGGGLYNHGLEPLSACGHAQDAGRLPPYSVIDDFYASRFLR